MFSGEYEIDGQYDGLEGKPYVYLFVSLSGEVFYVGKGLGDRFFRHISGLSVRTEANKRKYTRIREEFLENGSINVIFFPQQEALIYVAERYFINYYLPTLTNKRTPKPFPHTDHLINTDDCFFVNDYKEVTTRSSKL